MKSVHEIAYEIIAREGGYVNDPDDPGGATKFGVTLATLQRLGVDINGDGVVDAADVKVLPVEKAAEIFVAHYYNGPGLNHLPQALQPSVFDMYVNAGGNAIKILQRLLTQMGFPCAVDGQLGPKTIAATQEAYAQAAAHMVDAYGIARRNYYYALGDSRPQSRKYARRKDGAKGGWIARAEEFIAPHYHISAADHVQRTQHWG